MTAVVSRERARTTGLTAAAGVLMLAVAVVMMVMAAPGHGHVRAHLAKPSAVRLTTDVCHQLTSRGDSPAVRACQTVRQSVPASQVPEESGLSSEFRFPIAASQAVHTDAKRSGLLQTLAALRYDR